MRHEFENGNRLARVRKKHEHLMKKFPNADPAFLLLKAVEFEGLNYDCKFLTTCFVVIRIDIQTLTGHVLIIAIIELFRHYFGLYI